MPAAPRLISCDEAGFTGPDLLNSDQPFFVYSAIDLTGAEAGAIVGSAREKHRIQAPELKSKSLRGRGNWPEIACEIAKAANGRAMVISFDKRLSLAGKAFEYVFEPVLQDRNSLFYRSNIHRFVMNALHRAMSASGAGIDRLETELQSFMRAFDPASAPSWFSETGPGEKSSAVECIQRFARGYAERIKSGTDHLRASQGDSGKWTLDLTGAALFSLVWRGWGPRFTSIELLCDDSKPLRAQEEFLNQMGERPNGFSVTDGKVDVPREGEASETRSVRVVGRASDVANIRHPGRGHDGCSAASCRCSVRQATSVDRGPLAPGSRPRRPRVLGHEGDRTAA